MIRKYQKCYLKIADIWFDHEIFLKDSSDIKILHTPEPLDKKCYDLVFKEQTILIDLTKSENELLNSFHKNIRWAINRSSRDNITIIKAKSNDEYDQFYFFFMNFCKNKNFQPSSKDDILKQDLFLAYDSKGNFLGGSSFIKEEKHKIYRYKHNASIHHGQVNECLLFQAIKYAKEQGLEKMDLGGVALSDNKINGDYNSISKFKLQFGQEKTKFYTYVKIKNGILRVAVVSIFDLLLLFFKGDIVRLINLFRIKTDNSQ